MLNNLDSKISVHTFMISRSIKGKTWQALKNKFYTEANNNKDILAVSKSDNHISYYKYSQQGIIVYLTWFGDGENYTRYHRINIRVNPRRLIGDDTFIGVFEINQNNLDILENKLLGVLDDLGFGNREHHLEKGLKSFTMSRTDICINFHLEKIDTFINAVRKCFVPYGFTKFKAKNGKIPKSGIYLYSENMNVQIYNKLAQMLSEDYEYREEELVKAKNLARFELQLKRRKIYNSIKSGRLPCDFENGLGAMLIAIVCDAHWILYKYSCKIFGEYPYYSSYYLCKKINDRTYSTVELNVLLDFLEKIGHCHDAEKIAQKWEPNYTHTRIPYLFGKIGANIVPIVDQRFWGQVTPVLASVPQMVYENIKNNRAYLQELLELNSKLNGITYSYNI